MCPALDTVIAAERLGLAPLTTPAYRPKSNGMTEASVETMKCDEGDSADLGSAAAVLDQLRRWVADDNGAAPHSAATIPLDVQHVAFTGTYASLGPGALVVADADEFVIGHGLFGLLDAFPFQHPDRPDLSVSVPRSERLFGQGATG